MKCYVDAVILDILAKQSCQRPRPTSDVKKVALCPAEML